MDPNPNRINEEVQQNPNPCDDVNQPRKCMVRKREDSDYDSDANSERPDPKKKKVLKFDRGYDLQVFAELDLEETPFDKNAKVPAAKIVLQEDTLFILWHNGICMPYDRQMRTTLCLLNDFSKQDFIDDIWYNTNNTSLLTLRKSCHRNRPVVTSTTLRSIHLGEPENGSKVLFQNESDISNVEIEIEHNRAMVYNDHERVFKFYNLRNYRDEYNLADETFDYKDFTFQSPKNEEMLMYNRKNRSRHKIPLPVPNSIVPLLLFSKDEGIPTKQGYLPIWPKNGIKYITLCGEKLLVKQNDKGLMILDVSEEGLKKYPKNINRTKIDRDWEPIYLAKTQRFLTLFQNKVEVWSLEGEHVVTLEDHPMCHGLFSEVTHITENEEIIISYCKDEAQEAMEKELANKKTKTDANEATRDADEVKEDEEEESNEEDIAEGSEEDIQYEGIEEDAPAHIPGTINISCLRTGKCLGKITRFDPGQTEEKAAERAEALKKISALAYDENTHEIFTGNFNFVYRWSNRSLGGAKKVQRIVPFVPRGFNRFLISSIVFESVSDGGNHRTRKPPSPM